VSIPGEKLACLFKFLPSKLYPSHKHRHLSNIDCLMAHSTCLVCFISTVNFRCKKKPWKTGASSWHITNLKQYIFVFQYPCRQVTFSKLTHLYRLELTYSKCCLPKSHGARHNCLSSTQPDKTFLRHNLHLREVSC